MHLRTKNSVIESVREIVFGLEDSLVSTMGAVTGIAIGTEDRMVIILSGLVILAVEATSMSAGSFLSTETAERAEEKSDKVVHQRSIKAAFVMFVSYVFGGMLPLTPYLLLPPDLAILPSVILAVLALAGVGFWTGRFTKRAGWKTAIEMVVVSLVAAGIGYLVGWTVSHYFGINTIL